MASSSHVMVRHRHPGDESTAMARSKAPIITASREAWDNVRLRDRRGGRIGAGSVSLGSIGSPVTGGDRAMEPREATGPSAAGIDLAEALNLLYDAPGRRGTGP